MGSLSDINKVNVSTLTAGVKQAGFGLALIADYHTRWSDRIRTYADQASMIADGFLVSDAAYKSAGAALAQNPQPALVAIGRRTRAPDLTVDVIPLALNSTIYLIDVIGPTGVAGQASFTSDGTATVAEICTGLKAAIDALAITGLAAVTDATTKITIKASVAGSWFGVNSPDLSHATCQQVHADPGIAADLAELALVSGVDWYGVSLTTAGKAEITAAAAWVESNKKLMLQNTQDADCAGSGSSDLMTAIKTANEFRTALIFHPDGRTFAGSAWFGATLPADPGGITFKFRRLAGIPTVPLSETQITNLNGKNGNWFTDFGGIAITGEGKVSAGEFIDVIRDRDWFESRLQTRIFQVQVNSNKIPFTDPGIATIEGELRGQLDEAISAGFLSGDPKPVVVVPLASAVNPTDKAARKIKPISFSAKLAGAIHLTDITGTITV